MYCFICMMLLLSGGILMVWFFILFSFVVNWVLVFFNGENLFFFVDFVVFFIIVNFWRVCLLFFLVKFFMLEENFIKDRLVGKNVGFFFWGLIFEGFVNIKFFVLMKEDSCGDVIIFVLFVFCDFFIEDCECLVILFFSFFLEI